MSGAETDLESSGDNNSETEKNPEEPETLEDADRICQEIFRFNKKATESSASSTSSKLSDTVLNMIKKEKTKKTKKSKY